jgi:polyisoprenoid-binding protein YceI
MHGVSKEISIPFTFSKKGSKGTFIAKFSVDRTDYQIGKKNGGVAETIKITATIPVTKK